MYGTTIRSNENKSSKPKNNRIEKPVVAENREHKIASKKQQDTKYMKLNVNSQKEAYSVSEEKEVNEVFSLKDLPIASVVITVILTMMMLVLTSGFGGL
jgi:hypothetical protein